MYTNFSLTRMVWLLVFSCCLFCRTEMSFGYVAGDFKATPPFVTATAPPLVMLVMGRDDKLYAAAYNDASDLNEDGTLDVGYNPSIDYYGYFDSYKCYQYSSSLATTGGFTPVSTTTNKKCSGYWSGDWLNYVTMSRIDTLRKVLFGGKRVVDTTTQTVLRRTYIPQDAHSWGKEYYSEARDGYKISDYTPLSEPTIGRHLFANTTLSDNNYDPNLTKPLLRVLPNNVHRIWDWVAKERPEADGSLVSAGGNYSGSPSSHDAFVDLIENYAKTGNLQGTQSPTQINGTGNPFTAVDDYYFDITTGNLTVTTAGTYTIACDGDDAVEVLIDGTVITGWYGGHGANSSTAQTSHSASVTLSAGSHTLEFHHQEGTGSDSYYLWWKGPDSTNAWQIVPAAHLSGLTQKFYSTYAPASTLTDYVVQVQVCASGLLESNCKLYDNATTYKPIGLLQRHGESKSMLFGLLTGSYTKNTSGGVLRKNIGPITDEINPTTGQFITPSTGGIISTINNLRVTGYRYSDYSYYQNCGWITTRPINEGECRMWGNPIGEMMYETLRYFSGTKTPTTTFNYSATDTSTDDYILGLPHPNWIDPYDTSNGGYPYCSKPFMLVLSDVNPSFDSDTIPGANSNFGSLPAAVIGNSSNPALNVESLANDISTQEGITSGNYYIGQVASTKDGVCTAKAITGFGNIRGLCPEEPTKQGSYYAAAVAYYGHIHDISAAAQGNQYVTTYAVGLASPLPRIEIKVGNPTKTITLVPFGKSVGPVSPWSIYPDAAHFQPTESIAGFFVKTITPTYGMFRINYEDVEQGADHDQDALVVYEYQVVDAGGNAVSDPLLGTKVKITLTSTDAAGSVIQHMGYIISGTTTDGPFLEVRDSDTAAGDDPDYFMDTPPGVLPGGAYNDGVALPLVATREFTPGVGVTPASLLENPLWYAAKWGGFEDTNTPRSATDSTTYLSTPVPDLQTEWDKDDPGTPGYGVPDNYFYVINPLRLEEQLSKSFADILRRASSGTAASVISNSRSGEGAVYQSIFYPSITDGTTAANTVTWVGDVNAILVDMNGNLREDTNGNHKLDIAPTGNTDTSVCGDLIIVYNGGTVNKYCDWNGNSLIDTAESTPVTSGSINYLWRADNWLNSASLDPVNQRTSYMPSASDTTNLNRRYIFTFIDSDKTMVAGSGKQQDFACASLPTETDLTDQTKVFPYLNVYPPFETSAPSYIETIRTSYPTAFVDFLERQSCREINYIRGQDQAIYTSSTTPTYTLPKFRSRQYDYDTSVSGTETWRLGDIVFSTPTVVGAPAEEYHLLYKDLTYAAFLNKYLNRRQVVYVGANDGMLHAFNAGFYDSANKLFSTLPVVLSPEPYVDANHNGQYDLGESFTDCNGNGKWNSKGCSAYDSGITPFPLGAELWAYVPFNLLPHLFWLTEATYPHVYYVDEKPRVFDARIFFDAGGNAIDADHPNGWGTVMVVGMRFGGGTVKPDLDKTDGMAENTTGTTGHMDNVKMSSAYIVMDITNPETAPRVLAELKFPGLGYTTCFPTVIPMSRKGGAADANTDNEWSLVFGSGPAQADGTAGTSSSVSLHDAASGQKAKIYVVDLKALVASTPVVKSLNSSGSFVDYPTDGYYAGTNGYYQSFDSDRNAFISDPITVDYQLDFKADAVYFGTVSGNDTDGWGGMMRRIVMDPLNTSNTSPTGWDGDSILLGEEFSSTMRQPITAAANVTTDTQGNRWIFFGTGRFLVRTDATNTNQQSYFGIKEPYDSSHNWTWGTVTRASLVDVSNAVVYDDRSVVGVTGATDWTGLLNLVGTHSGWRIDFSRSGERNVGQAALLGGTLTFTTYVPSTDICAFEGNSFLYAEYYRTGTSYFKPMLGRLWIAAEGKFQFITNIPLGVGLAATANIHLGGESGSKAYMQTSSGDIVTIDIENAYKVKSGIRAWKLYED